MVHLGTACRRNYGFWFLRSFFVDQERSLCFCGKEILIKLDCRS